MEIPYVKNPSTKVNPDRKLDHKKLRDIRNYTIVPSTRTAKAIVEVSGNPFGDFTDIQTAIDYTDSVGGGIIFIRNGTYLLDDNLVVPSGVNLVGETDTGVIIDFQGEENQIQVIGENAYTTGTITIGDTDTTVVGSGTTWTSAMVGRSILLAGSWYLITAFVDTTHITIESEFSGDSLIGETYVISDPVSNVEISKMTVQNSAATDGAVVIRYANQVFFNRHLVILNVLGLGIYNSSTIVVEDVVIAACYYGIEIDTLAGLTYDQGYITDIAVGDGFSLTNTTNSVINNFSSINCAANGMTFTSCSDIGTTNFSIDSNTVHGIELISCTELQIHTATIKNNGTDGLKFTSGCTNNAISLIVFRNNGNDGVNVAAASDIDNIILGNVFKENIATTVADSGTTTLIRSNVGIADN